MDARYLANEILSLLTGDVIGDASLDTCIDWVTDQSPEHLADTSLAELAQEYEATFDEIDVDEFDSLTPAQQAVYRYELTGQVPDRHHPDCQCNRCHYGANADKWLHNPSEY